MLNRRDFLTYSLATMAVPVAQHHGTSLFGGLLSAETPDLPLISARMADDICQSYMVNTKFIYYGSVYKHMDAVLDLLRELGVRTVRERVEHGPTMAALKQSQAMPLLAASGIRWHATVGSLGDWPNATAVNQAVMDHLASFYAPQLDGDLSALMHSLGGCNEIDGPVTNGQVDPEWAAHARLMQQALWEAAKGNPLTASIPVAGPSTRTDFTPDRAAELGDLSAWSDLGNAHYYHKGASPTRGIDGHLAMLRTCFPSAPRWLVTEAGYNNSRQTRSGKTIPESATAVYAVRGICDFFNRDAIYGRFELLDDPDVVDFRNQKTINATTERGSHFGLVAMTKTTVKTATPATWRKKPEFYAVQRFLQLMSDRGDVFPPEGLQMQVTGAAADLQRALVQKRDGRHYLLLWRDVNVCKPYPSGTSLVVPPVTVSVTMAAQRPVALYQPGTQSEPITTMPVTDAFDVPVGKDLVVAEVG